MLAGLGSDSFDVDVPVSVYRVVGSSEFVDPGGPRPFARVPFPGEGKEGLWWRYISEIGLPLGTALGRVSPSFLCVNVVGNRKPSAAWGQEAAQYLNKERAARGDMYRP